MRIGFDAKRAFSNYTGLGNYSRDTIRVLEEFYPKNQYFLFTPKFTENKRLDFIEGKKNIHTIYPNNLFNKIFSSYWRTKNIVQQIKNNKIDLYHGLSHELPIGIENINIKKVVTIHDLIYLRYPKLFSNIDRKIYDKKFRSACDRADKIIAVSQQTKTDIIDFFKIEKDKIDVVYQGCNQVFKTKRDQQEISVVKNKFNLFEKYLLYVGSIEKRKNLLTLLKSINDLKHKNLIVIGDGSEYKKECLEYINKNKLNSRVKILSGLNLFDMSCIYQEAEMMIYPSVFEGFGIPIIEALNSKIPVITTKGGCFHESGGDHSLYIDPLSSDDISNAILSIEKNKSLKESMIENGYKHAQNFNDEIIARDLFKSYNSI